MAIFGSTKVIQSGVIADENMNVSQKCFVDMMESFASDIYRASAATYISDIRMEEAVSEGVNVDILMENVVGDFFGRIIEAFKKLGTRIMGWFKAFRRWLELIFKHGEAFVKKFRKDIEDKSATGYEYESYKYNQGTGDTMAKKITDQLSAEVKTLCDGMESSAAKEKGSWEEKLGTEGKEFKKDYESEKGMTDIVKKTLGFDDKSKMIADIKKAYRGDTEDKTTLKDFEGTSKDLMMKFIEGKKSQISEVQTEETKFKRDIDEIISALEKSKSKFSENAELRGKIGDFINHTTKMLRECVTLYGTVNEIRKQMYGEMATAFETTLKGFLHYKPAKAVTDSYVNVDASMNSLLESSMKYV